MVTALTIHINKAEASAALHEPDPADAFKRKVKLLENWLMNHPAYAAVVDDWHARFFLRLKEMAETRNTIIHGHLRAYDRSARKFEIGIIRRAGKDTWRVQTVQFHIEALQEIADLSNMANKELVRIADAIFLKDDGAASPETP